MVNNVRDALECLAVKSYSILILDLNLPIRADALTKPRRDSGISILHKLGLEQYNTPDTIIGLTSYSELKDDYESKFSELAFKVYLFESEDWRTVINKKISWLKKSLRQKERLSTRSNKKTITLLVHGVMTAGEWQDSLKTKFESSGHSVFSYKYKFYSALKIVCGISRMKQAEHFGLWLEKQFIENPSSNINIVAHSFGTYLVLKALELLRLDNMTRIDNIILLGSVMPRNYNFGLIEKKFMPKKIINECGTKDLPLLASKAFCFGLGNAGRAGFNSGSEMLINRYYEAGHSIFDEVPDYYELYWERYVQKGELSDAPIVKSTRYRVLRESLFDTLSPVLVVIIILFFLIVALL